MTARSAGEAGEIESPGRAGSDRLTEPLALRGRRPGDIPLLAALQPNILRPHVRDSLRLLLIQITDPAAARASIGRIARNPRLMKTAADHFDEVDAHRGSQAPGSAFVGIALSHSGYQRLEVPHHRFPADAAFREGMSARGGALRDPDRCVWDYAQPIDMIVLVGSHEPELTAARVALVLDDLRGIRVLAEEPGETLHNKQDEPIEHFGYVDGRSQPLFVREDADHERDTKGGIDVWDPLVSLDRVLVPDPGVSDRPDCYGSYLIYRKLEQNVRAFEAKERLVAKLVRLRGADKERAGAMLVGRFEDGTPVAIRPCETGAIPALNNFTYADDERGMKCPHFAHIRMMNDRALGPRERVVIARRGQTYGSRPDLADPNASPPVAGVGLLFMAVVSDIPRQFEQLQQAANGDETHAGDPVIGQGPAGGAALKFPRVWGRKKTRSCPDALMRPVTMKGGEYFFLPSITFLRHLDRGP